MKTLHFYVMKYLSVQMDGETTIYFFTLSIISLIAPNRIIPDRLFDSSSRLPSASTYNKP